MIEHLNWIIPSFLGIMSTGLIAYHKFLMRELEDKVSKELYYREIDNLIKSQEKIRSDFENTIKTWKEMQGQKDDMIIRDLQWIKDNVTKLRDK